MANWLKTIAVSYFQKFSSPPQRVYPFEVLINPEDSGLSKVSKVQAQQIRTISKERIKSDVVGSLSAELMMAIDTALKLHLGLD